MARFCFLVHPSTNRVYARDAARLAVGELRAVASLAGLDVAGVAEASFGGVPYVAFEAGEGDDAVLAAVSNLSTVYALFAVPDEGRLAPVDLCRLDRWDDDLLTIQRYPGKTNEQFTRLLVNLAVAAASGPDGFAGAKLRVLDPLCGRGTTLNQAVMYGFDACGIDVDRRDVDAYTSFFVQWLKDKRVKHSADRSTVHAAGRPAPRFDVRFAPTKQDMRDGNAQHVAVVAGDTSAARELFRGVDAVVADLPYGVQHGSTSAGGDLSRSPAALLSAALPAWAGALRPGGAVALSWNANVIARDDVAASLRDTGLTVLLDDAVAADSDEAAADDAADASRIDFSHRVDRAVVRDVVVARKPSRP